MLLSSPTTRPYSLLLRACPLFERSISHRIAQQLSCNRSTCILSSSPCSSGISASTQRMDSLTARFCRHIYWWIYSPWFFQGAHCQAGSSNGCRGSRWLCLTSRTSCGKAFALIYGISIYPAWADLLAWEFLVFWTFLIGRQRSILVIFPPYYSLRAWVESQIFEFCTLHQCFCFSRQLNHDYVVFHLSPGLFAFSWSFCFYEFSKLNLVLAHLWLWEALHHFHSGDLASFLFTFKFDLQCAGQSLPLKYQSNSLKI